ncbi:hypothetical protein [Kitasatospora sp. NPDC091276]
MGGARPADTLRSIVDRIDAGTPYDWDALLSAILGDGGRND